MKIIVGYVSNSFIVVHDKSHFSSVDIFEINIIYIRLTNTCTHFILHTNPIQCFGACT